jgi:hypothetical protein
MSAQAFAVFVIMVRVLGLGVIIGRGLVRGNKKWF